ncbi:MAG: EamA family transporter [Desulfobacterales bacterium]|nr:EamA family transporter [Desulfobacterales bacterium]
MNSPILKGYAFLLIAATLFGTTGTAQMLGGQDVPPWIIGAFRLVIGGPLLLVISFLATKQGTKAEGPPRYGLILASSLGTVLFQFTFFEAVARTGVATGTLVSIGSGPIFAGLLGAFFLKEPLDKAWGVATALAISGCVFLVSPGKGLEMDPVGIGLALSAGFGYAVYVVGGKDLARTMGPARAVGSILTWGAGFMFPFLIFADLSMLINGKVIATLGYLGIFATALSYFLLTRGLTVIPVASATVILLVEPLVGSFLGVCLLGEPVTLSSGTGMVLLFAGMAVIAFKQLKTPASV